MCSSDLDAPKPQDEPWTERIKTAGQACDVEAFYAGLADIGLTYKGAFIEQGAEAYVVWSGHMSATYYLSQNPGTLR